MINTGKLAGKTLFITGASRGIGKAIALKAAKDGANVIVAAKTAEPHPKLPGTIYTAAKEIEDIGGQSLACVVDVRDEQQITKAVEEGVRKFGGIDIVINNASAISLTPTVETDMKRYDLMHHINTRGTFLVSKICIPYLKKSSNGHILNLSPPLNMNPLWFKNHLAYTMAKYGMSMCVLGMAEELKEDKIAVNALWPRTSIQTAAMDMLAGKESSEVSRKPEIMADAAYAILCKTVDQCTGKFLIDDEVLIAEGITDLKQYAVNPNNIDNLMPDFFLDTQPDPRIIANIPKGNQPAQQSAAGGGSEIDKIFYAIESNLSPELVQKTQASFQFKIKTPGEGEQQWYVDLKSGKGTIGKGECPSAADATLTMSNKDFLAIFTGKIKASGAFMLGRLKIAGNMQKALKLEKLMGSLKSKL